MKKITIILILFTFSFSSVFAQSSTSSGGVCIQVITPLRNSKTNECKIFPTPCDVPANLGVEWKQDQTCLQENSTSTATSTKQSKIEQRNEKIRNYTAQMQERLNVIVGNLERTALRVETQINKLASSTATSTDLSAARAKLADAKKKIEELKTGIAGLGQKTEEVIASKTPKTAFSTVREKLVKAFVAKIKVIHKELLDSVKLAKKEIAKINAQNATSTQDVSDWKTYRNEKYGFEFKYPSGFKLAISTDRNIFISNNNVNQIVVDIFPDFKDDISKFSIFDKTKDGLNIYFAESTPPSYTYVIIKGNVWFSLQFNNLESKIMLGVLKSFKFIK